MQNKVIVLNLHFKTSKKLAVVQKTQSEVAIDDAMESHMFRFESLSQSEDWLLTDIDNCLDGNPYFEA